ncbi:hypothetical protein [Limnohabitans sp. 2KL-17]|uniref:hypothetical protein n=1 Tax=Limnohabitans sp. 2KL-17 TaxID=1100704 RepID=UPI0011B21035|nr:hypothetical protein [Limnohabitans sp. 2KL-17]
MPLLSLDAFTLSVRTVRITQTISQPTDAGSSVRSHRWALGMVWAWATYVTFWLGLFAHGSPTLLDVCRAVP